MMNAWATIWGIMTFMWEGTNQCVLHPARLRSLVLQRRTISECVEGQKTTFRNAQDVLLRNCWGRNISQVIPMICFKTKPNNSLKFKSANQQENGEDIKDETVKFLWFNKHSAACSFSLNQSDGRWIKIMKDVRISTEVYVRSVCTEALSVDKKAHLLPLFHITFRRDGAFLPTVPASFMMKVPESIKRDVLPEKQCNSLLYATDSFSKFTRKHVCEWVRTPRPNLTTPGGSQGLPVEVIGFCGTFKMSAVKFKKRKRRKKAKLTANDIIYYT